MYVYAICSFGSICMCNFSVSCLRVELAGNASVDRFVFRLQQNIVLICSRCNGFLDGNLFRDLRSHVLCPYFKTVPIFI